MLTFFLFCASVISSSLSQYWQKRAATYLAANPQFTLVEKVLNKPIILSVAFLGLGAITWLAVLTDWHISTAYPLLSINFVVMLLVSKYCFDESINTKQWLGVASIMLGIALMSGALT